MHYTFTIINKAASITALKQYNIFLKLHATLVTIIIKLNKQQLVYGTINNNRRTNI